MNTHMLVILIILGETAGEYLIGDKVPSYLYKNFKNVIDKTFPRLIRINMTITRVEGTLLYSIDRHLNQLIVNLDLEPIMSLHIEVNSQLFIVRVPELCGCERGRFEVLDLTIMLWERLDLVCNGGAMKTIKYNRVSKSLNRAYIIPYDGAAANSSSPNEAHLWLVNHPQYGSVYPNPRQMSGCIFSVIHRDKEVHFTEARGDISSKCLTVCHADICHGGRCHETYNGHPLCECTTTFNNGPFCNDTICSLNARIERYLKFEIFKLSWKSNSNEIFVLTNTNVEIRISRSGSLLTLQYRSKEGGVYTGTSELSPEYVPNGRYILICEFAALSMNIKMYNGTSWTERVLKTDRDLRRVTFKSLQLRSGNGSIGVAFKEHNYEYYWKSLILSSHSPLVLEDPHTKISVAKNNDVPQSVCQMAYLAFGITVAAVVVSMTVAIGVCWYYRKKKAFMSASKQLKPPEGPPKPEMGEDDAAEMTAQDNKGQEESLIQMNKESKSTA